MEDGRAVSERFLRRAILAFLALFAL